MAKARKPRGGDASKGLPPTSEIPALRAFLSGEARPDEGALGFTELRGFLFAIASAPELIPPSEWIPLVFGNQEPRFDTKEHAEQILGGLMALYNEINAEVFDGEVRLPEDCRFRDDLLSNMEEDAPVSQWSRGFIRGHSWLNEIWDELLPDELEEEFGALFLTLSFFASRRVAEQFLAEETTERISLIDMARALRKVFPDAMAGYAHLGRSIHQALMEHPPEEVGRVGRNDPCPCGSGMKYKKCCGVS
jgi:uncharacterized protein